MMQLRTMTESDIAAGMRLKDVAGWNQAEADWKRFLSASSDGCFVMEVDGAVRGTATTIVYSGRFAWVGMVLVDRSHNDPAGLVPIHRKLYQLLTAGKLTRCAAVLARHLEDSESRLSRIMNREMPRREVKQAVASVAMTGVDGRIRK